MTATCDTATATAAAAIEDAAALEDATKDTIADATAAAETAFATAPASAAAAAAEAASFSKKRKAVDDAVGEKDLLVASLDCIIAKKRKGRCQAALDDAGESWQGGLKRAATLS